MPSSLLHLFGHNDRSNQPENPWNNETNKLKGDQYLKIFSTGSET